MIKTALDLFVASIIVTLLVVLVSTSSNLIWLNSMNLPIDLNLATSTFLKDIIGMNFNSQIPLYLLISIPLVLFLYSTKLILKILFSKKIYPYALAGSISMLILIIALPLALDNLEPISGSRTTIGKIFMTICGCLGGYFYGVRQLRQTKNEIL
tara:strand:- start:1780 stop:2241 length:462 start_codon:yes stop_codon:yes gene_type:complete